ncbi:protein FAR1-RELATED SEQUENCE 5-like [Rutidosis leptorrhynchoides]|uniref:protein FAR1-RELATED SEQUENCE 5-like n=1 Tax=Rutidosis leptorrhynchoides TaxID=125765 RepID=UPI003A9924EB
MEALEGNMLVQSNEWDPEASLNIDKISNRLGHRLAFTRTSTRLELNVAEMNCQLTFTLETNIPADPNQGLETMSIGDKNFQVDDLIHRNDQFHVKDDFVVNDGNDDEQSHFFDVSDEFDHIEIFEHHDTDGECVYVPKSFCVGSEEISSSGIKSWTPNVDESLLPAIGTVFDSIDLAYNFYKEYAVNGGFEQGSNQEILHKPEYVSATDDIFDMNADCFGEVNTLTYVDDNFVKAHNHILVHPHHIKHLKSQRRLNNSQKSFLFKLNQTGIGPCRGYRILGKVKGGDEDVGCSKVDCKNWKRDVIKYIGEGDGEMFVQQLENKKKSLNNFSFEYFTVFNNDKWELAGAFWADQASKENYKVFGDVVSFDSTYRTNKYDMKFIQFTGIDNHKKCVTFGAALLAKEDVDSYKWLCEAFKKAFPEEPQIVLTDQDLSMIVAIEAIFKKARHRLCMLHVTEKITNKVNAQKLGQIHQKFGQRWSIIENSIGPAVSNVGFKDSISQIVWTDKLDPDDFDKRWFSIVARYKLEDNEWLNEMFKHRRKWIPAYFRYWDMSGLMRTSSHSESENHMFQQLMSNSSTLVEFISFFETAMQIQRQGQIKAASRYCMNYQVDHKNGFTEYTVMDRSVRNNGLANTLDKAGNPRAFDEYIPAVSVVKYSEKSKEVSCDCRLFERIGYFCRHILYVLRMTNVKVIPNKYVMKRWCIDAITLKDPNTYFDSNQVGSSGEFGVQMKEIYEMIDHAIGLYKDDPEKLSSLKDTIRGLKDKAVEQMGNDHTLSKDEFIEGLVGIPKPDKVSVYCPNNLRSKGCGKRITNVREEAIKQQTINHRTCSFSNEVGHNSRGCKVRKQKILEKKN